jgi:hypothetical protein
MRMRERQRLIRELDVIKRRMRAHGFEVAYARKSRSLSEHIADIKRRDEIEALITNGDILRS